MANSENILSTPTNNLTSRPTAQSLRGLPSSVQPTPPPMPGTMRTTRSQMDNRKSQFIRRSFRFFLKVFFLFLF